MPDPHAHTPAPAVTGSPVTELRLVLTVDDHARAVTFYRDTLGL